MTVRAAVRAAERAEREQDEGVTWGQSPYRGQTHMPCLHALCLVTHALDRSLQLLLRPVPPPALPMRVHMRRNLPFAPCGFKFTRLACFAWVLE